MTKHTIFKNQEKDLLEQFDVLGVLPNSLVSCFCLDLKSYTGAGSHCQLIYEHDHPSHDPVRGKCHIHKHLKEKEPQRRVETK